MDHGPADASAEPGRSGLFQAVGLVEDDRLVLGQDPGALGTSTQRQIGEVERVVCDDELRVRGALPRGLGEAHRREGAAAAEASVGSDCDLGPDASGWLDLELGSVAGLGRHDPVAHRLERRSVLGSGKELPAEQLEAVEPMAAQVVLAALQDGNLDVTTEHGRRDGHVLRQELLL